MRVIERIFEYLKYHNLTPHTFERACGMANGYLKKQEKGKGSIGSEILEKIISTHRDLSLTWLVTGKGKMLVDPYARPDHQLKEEANSYSSEHTISVLREKIEILERSISDKEKIIKLLEAQISGEKAGLLHRNQ